MKRFFCTICQRVKRVRSLPSNVVNSMTPEKRTGTCDKHDTLFTGKSEQMLSMARAQNVPVTIIRSKKRA